MKIYLAGSVTPNPKHLNWRKDAETFLHQSGFRPINPVRFQSPAHWDALGLTDATVPPSFLVDADLSDVRQCDAMLLVFWKGLARQSIGSWFEFATAANAGKPVVIVTDDPDIATHPFIQRRASIVVSTVEEGLDWIVRLAH